MFGMLPMASRFPKKWFIISPKRWFSYWIIAVIACHCSYIYIIYSNFGEWLGGTSIFRKPHLGLYMAWGCFYATWISKYVHPKHQQCSGGGANFFKCGASLLLGSICVLGKLRKIENRNKPKKKTRFPSTFVSFLHSGPAKLHFHKKKYGKQKNLFGWWFGTFFQYIVNVIIPTDKLRFFRGRWSTNQLDLLGSATRIRPEPRPRASARTAGVALAWERHLGLGLRLRKVAAWGGRVWW